MRCFSRVEYNGTAYAGWQIQDNENTIQAELQSAFSTVTRVPSRITGAGRTDAGVHARGQGMHIDLPETVDLKQCENSVNAVLPHDIGIYSLQRVNDSFHARYCATERSYRYYMITRKMPLRRDQALWVDFEVNWDSVRENIAALMGKHDFTAFCASGCSVDNKTCTIREATLIEKNNEYIFTIKADRFIYKMVRSLVGTLLDIGRCKITDSMSDIIKSKERSRVGETAAAHGLVLEYVTYPEVR